VLVQSPQNGLGVLLRLAREDPSNDVRWGCVTQLRRLGNTTVTPDMTPTDVNRPPNLALAGWAWERRDPNVSLALLERCVDLETKQPTAEPEIVLVFFDLATQYTARRRYDDAAEMHRRGYARNPMVVIHRGNEQTDHMEMLFFLHARYGPLKAFDEDLATAGKVLTRPTIQFCVARAYERAGQPLLAHALYSAANLSVPDVWRAHTDAGQLLLRLGLPDQAERHYESVVRTAGNDTAGAAAANAAVVNAQLQLAGIAARRGEDFAAAERMRRVLEGPLPAGARFESTAKGRLQRGDEARAKLEAEMHWRYLRAARSKQNANSIKAHLKELLRLKPDNPDIALDVVPLLREQGRTEDAAALFAAPYQAVKADLAAQPGNPQRMNTLAWLCVRCGQHVDEALKLAEAAVALDPDNPAYLDTAAEANFQSGNVDRAIKLESRAIELRPTDTFMKEQLQRFQAPPKK
jgi:tetratricopeptide (TPR) repeat protein